MIVKKKLKKSDKVKTCWNKEICSFDFNITAHQLEKLVEKNPIVFL